MTEAELVEIEKRTAASAPIEECDIMRYDHGGGRIAILKPDERKLIADFYHEEDREFYILIREKTPALLTALRAEQARADGLAERVQKLEERLEIDHAFEYKDGEFVRFEIAPEHRDNFPDKISCLEADLESAINVAWKHGAKEWVRKNYPDRAETLEAKP